VQFVLSAIESYYGFFFVRDYFSAMRLGGFEKRSLFPLIGLPDPFTVLNFGFSGLLGAHNFWGSQLPFYNLIFYLAYEQTRKRYYLMMMGCVFAAILLNTTRVSTLTILITDLILLIRNARGNKFRLALLTVPLLVSLPFLISSLVQELSFLSSSQTDNLLIRLRIWDLALYYVTEHPASLLFGLGFPTMQTFVLSLTELLGYGRVLSSFENAFFDIVFSYGFVGLSTYLYLLYRIIIFTTPQKGVHFLSLLLAFNILGVSVTLGGILYEFVLPFVTLIFVCLVLAIGNPNDYALHSSSGS
jgi:hypothetical protein